VVFVDSVNSFKRVSNLINCIYYFSVNRPHLFPMSYPTTVAQWRLRTCFFNH